MKTYLSKFTVLFLVILTPNFAHAHSMQMTAVDWISGFIHPLQGLDHIVAMLAVGVWAMQLRGHALWLLPLTFISVMVLGGLLGMTGLAVSSVELIILLSGLVLSVLAVKKVRFSLKINVLIVAFFAFFHGYAHGYELTDSADFLSYSLGFMVATAFLHGVGMMLSLLVQAALYVKNAVRL